MEAGVYEEEDHQPTIYVIVKVIRKIILEAGVYEEEDHQPTIYGFKARL